MSEQGAAHSQIHWAKERLDEIDATLTTIEKKVGSLQTESRAKVELTIAEMRAQRDAFKDAINANHKAGEEAWRGLQAKLETGWTTFETAVQVWAHETRDQVELQKAVAVARVDAQVKALNEALSRFKTSAKDFTAARKSEAEAAFKAAQAQADEAKAKVEGYRQAGKESWGALNNAFVQTRAALDRANKAAGQTGRAA